VNLARTATWLAGGRGAQAATAFVLPIVLVRALNQDDYGLWKQIDLAATLLSPFLILGFDKSVTYFVPRRQSRPADEVSTPILAMLIASAVVMVFAALFPAVLGRLLGTAGVPLLVAAATLSGVATSVSYVASRGLIAVDAPRAAALLPVVVGIPRTITLVALAFWFPRLDWILAAVVVFAVLHVIASLAALAWKRCLRAALNIEVLRKQVKYGGSLAVAALAQTWAQYIDRFLVSGSLGSATFAIYSVGKLHIPFLPVLPRAIGDATAPRFSKLESEGRHVEMATLLRKSCEVLLPINLLLTASLYSTAHWSIPLVFTEQYRESVPIFRIFTFSILLGSFTGVEQMLRALAAIRFLVTTVFLSLATRLALGVAALAMGSLTLMVAAHLVVAYVFLSIQLAYTRRRLGVGWGAVFPHEGVAVPAALAVGGVGATMGIDRALGARPLAALVVAGVLWAALLGAAIWRQGLWRRLGAQGPTVNEEAPM
jgi:O-antigen/teichoic acid export membrane protein